MSNHADFEFLRRAGQLLADRGPDLRLESADVIEVDEKIVYWPDSAQHAADEEIRIFDSWDKVPAR